MALQYKLLTKIRRKAKIRARISGTSSRPRLTTYVSRQHVTAQLIDDATGRTLAASHSRKLNIKGSLTAKAEAVGADIAAKAKLAKISSVVFDRNGHPYHGRVKALGDKAREAGLEF